VEFESASVQVVPRARGGQFLATWSRDVAGNLADITLRAVRVLRGARAILAEDTRHTRKLLNHLGIRTPLWSLHEHNEKAKLSQVLRHLDMGDALALVSDAGTSGPASVCWSICPSVCLIVFPLFCSLSCTGMPAISDPGLLLVAAAVEAGHRVYPIPGPSAALAALVASGLPTAEFMFVGFLPAKAMARRRRLQELTGELLVRTGHNFPTAVDSIYPTV
jgi:16S rRNA (cytidine1402-2'-O)-methyltransferase